MTAPTAREQEYDRLLVELKELGVMKEACLGCGQFYHKRGCGCPAGSCYMIDKDMLRPVVPPHDVDWEDEVFKIAQAIVNGQMYDDYHVKRLAKEFMVQHMVGSVRPNDELARALCALHRRHKGSVAAFLSRESAAVLEYFRSIGVTPWE